MDWRELERERVRLHPEQVRYPTWQCHHSPWQERVPCQTPSAHTWKASKKVTFVLRPSVPFWHGRIAG
jgi:hypothetical protein